MICSNCGKTLNDGAKFCPFCGTPTVMKPKAPQPGPVYTDLNVTGPTVQAVNPAPSQPVQPAPAPVNPAPVNQAPVNPTPVYTAPVNQAPVNPAPANPLPTQPVQRPVQPAPEPAPKKKKKWLVPVIIIGAVTLLLLGGAAALFFFLFNNKTETVNINDYLKVSFSGYNGYGEAEWTLDQDRFEEDFAEKLKWKKRGDYGMTAQEAVLNSAYPSLSEYYDLTNGDKVKVKWDVNDTISEVINVELVAEDQTITVSGLTEPKEVDPLADLVVEFAGYNGKGHVESAEYASSEEWLESIPLNQDFSTLDELSNGDTVTFSFDLEDYTRSYLIREYGVLPTVTERTITVSGLQDVETFDPFEGIEVIFAGRNGSGYVSSISVINADPACMNIYYDYSWDSNFSNGDEIVISIDEEEYTSDWFLQEYGKIANVFEKTFIVSGLIEGLQDLSDIPKDQIDAFDNSVCTVYAEDVMPQYEEMVFTMQDILPLGMTLLVREDPENTDTEYENILYAFYQVTVNVEGSDSPVYTYVPVYVTDIPVDDNGVPHLEFDGDYTYIATSEAVHMETEEYYLDLTGFGTFDELLQVTSPDFLDQNKGMIEAGSTLGKG